MLSLLQQMPSDAATRKQIGRLLLQFGLAKESADVFREVLEGQPEDAEANAGLGEAELALNDLSGAQTAFQRAVRREPGAEGYKKRLQLVEETILLDPAMRGLTGGERYRRSRRLVEAALGAWDQCVATKSGAAGDAARGAADEARKILLVRRAPRSNADAAEADVALAEQLWSARVALCGAGRAEDPLGRAMTLVSR